MSLSSDPLKSESEVAARPLYRAGETQPASKAPKKAEKSSFWGGMWGGGSKPPAKPPAKQPTMAPSPYPAALPRPGQPVSVKKTAPSGSDGQPSRWKRILKAALIVLIMFALGTGSYYAFEPNYVEEFKEARNAARKAAFDPNLTDEQRREKFKEIRKLEKNLTPKERMELEKDGMKRMLSKTREFGKLSEKEKIEQVKKDIKEWEARRQQWMAQRNANGGGGQGGRGGGGAGGGNGGRGGGGAGGGGANNRGGGGAGGGAGAGRGGGGGPGGGGFGGPGGGGPGGWGGRGGGGNFNQAQKTRLDNMSPEDRANLQLQRGMMRQMGGGFGGGFGGGRGPGR